MNLPVVIPTTDQSLQLAPIAEQAREYAKRAKAKSTLRCYEVDWKDFTGWCQQNALLPLPATPQTVALYLSAQADRYKVATIQRRLSAISQVHQVRGFESPTKNELVRSVVKGIRRTLGVAQAEKAPLMAADIREMVSKLPDTLNGNRDRALLLLGFAGAFRRSELVALNVEDLEFTPDGLIVLVRRSKTDQEGVGKKIGIPLLPTSDACPVHAVKTWLTASGITTGPIFRPVTQAGGLGTERLSDRAIAVTVKKHLPRDRDRSKFAGHSLRAGFVTSAVLGGASLKAIMNQTRHRSLETLMRYMRDASLFRGNALGATGL